MRVEKYARRLTQCFACVDIDILAAAQMRGTLLYDITFDSGNTVFCGGTPDEQVVIFLRTKHMRTSTTIARRWYRYWHNGEIELTNVKD